MARQFFIPGAGYINETGTRQYLLPGHGYANETVAAATTVVNRRTLGPRVGSRQGGFVAMFAKKG